MKKFYNSLLAVLFSVAFIGGVNAQNECIPTSVRPVFGTVSAASGTFNFNNIPTGNVIQVNAPAAGLVYTIDLCATNPTTVADGVNDSQITVLDANSAAANFVGYGDDGCTTNTPEGYGPTTFTWSPTAAGTYFLYLTEWNLAGTANCIADGVNTSYLMTLSIAGAGPCEAGAITSPLVQNVCPGNLATITLSGTIAADGDFAIGFDNSPGGTGGNNGAFSIINIDDTQFPYTFDAGVNGIMAANSFPDLAGIWAVKVYAIDAAGFPCDSTAQIINVNFLDATDPLCGGSGFDAGLVFSSLGEYSAVPLSQVQPIVPTCTVQNLGTSTVTGVSVTTNIYNGANTIVYTATNNTIASLASGATGTITDGGAGYTPTTTDFYLAEFIVSINETDGDITNDTIFDAILIEDSLYSRDFATIIGNDDIAGALGVGAGNTGIFGNVFEVFNTADIVNVETIINGGLAIGDTTRAHVYSMAAGLPNVILGTTDLFITAIADTPVFDIVLPFNPPITLTPGEYFIGLEEFSNTDNIGCLTSNNIYTLNKTLGSVNGGAFSDIASLGVAAQVFLVRPNLHSAVAPTCAISDVSSPSQTACNSANNQYSAQVTVTYTNAPASGMLSVNGQMFAIGTSPQTVNLTGLISDGAPVNVTAVFTADAACTYTENAVFTAPAGCLCSITGVSGSVETGCDVTTNNYTAQVVVTYSNAPTSGMLNVNGQMFAIGTSPQTVTLTGLNSNGSAVNVTAAFTADAACTFTQNNAYTAPVACLCAGYTVTETITNETCQSSNGAISLVVSGGTGTLNYIWSPGGATSQSISGLSAGPYSVTITDDNGCPETFNYTVTNTGTVPSLSFTSTPVTNCTTPNGTATVTSSNPIQNVMWMPSGQATATATGLAAGTQTVTVTDLNGCVATGSTSVSNAAGGLSALLDGFTDVTCNGLSDGTIDITVTGGLAPISYNWSDVGIPSSQQDRTGLPAGSYSVTIQDANNCSFSLGPVTIAEPAALQITVNGFDDISCSGLNDGSIIVTGSGGTSPYEYTSNNIVYQPSGTFGNLSAGSYTITVRDDNGCTASSPAIPIVNPAALNITLNGSSDVSCNGANDGEVVTMGSGGTAPLVYSLDGGITTQATGTFSGLSGGNYTVTVVDANGCVNTTSATVAEPAALVVTVDNSSDISCNGAGDGTINVTSSGGTAPLTYDWGAGNPTTEDLSAIGAGTYTLTVTDANGCSETTLATTITEPTELTLTVSSTPESSAGSADGTATVAQTGGTAPYTYAWSPGGQSASAAVGLSAGDYTVIVTDANGCTEDISVLVDLDVAIGEIELNELQLYPNPTEGTFTLSFETSKTMNITFSIMNTIGKVVYVDAESNINGSFVKTFNMNNFAAGIYFLEIDNGNGTLIQKVTLSK